MVERYEDTPSKPRRTDEEVWTSFKRDLERHNIAVRLGPKKITVPDDEVEFEHAYRNGIWHCLKPISFDMTAEGMADKAHKWLGQLTSVRGASEPFKVYLLIGEPQHQDSTGSLKRALTILQKIPVEKEIVLEKEAFAFSARFADTLSLAHGVSAAKYMYQIAPASDQEPPLQLGR